MTTKNPGPAPLHDHERIAPLDGLRAFAIFSVMLCHSSLYFAPLAFLFLPFSLENVFYNGWFGVDLFFVLSGFLITSQLLDKPLTRKNFTKFCARRFFRIAPAYYVSLTTAVLIFKVLPDYLLGTSPEQWILPYLIHLAFLQDYIPIPPRIDGIYWSIPIEIKFYLLCPFLVYGLSHLRRDAYKIILLALFILIYTVCKFVAITEIYAASPEQNIDYFWDIKTKFHFALDGLLGGFLCAHIYRNPGLSRIIQCKKVANSLFIIGLAILMITIIPDRISPENIGLSHHILIPSIFAFSFCLILLGSLGGCFATKFLSNVLLGFIAKISYSLYLLHFLGYWVQGIFHSKILAWTENNTLSWVLSLPFYIGFCICVAYLLYVSIEKPFIDWAKRKWP